MDIAGCFFDSIQRPQMQLSAQILNNLAIINAKNNSDRVKSIYLDVDTRQG
jgi:hypothetical protein